MSNSIPVPKRVRPLLQQIGRLAQTEQVSACAVGGCVRDWLLEGAATPDLDIAVEGKASALAQAAARELGGVVRVHEQFGTATLERQTAPKRIDFAMCRKERYVRPAAYPAVTPGTLEEDLFRRDFTINAMAVSLVPERFGVLVDPFHGRQDLAKRVLRILHPRSFLDDPTRILRGIRFRQRFGLRFDPDTEKVLRGALAEGALSWLNPGRLQRELDRMCDEPNPLACFRELQRRLKVQ